MVLIGDFLHFELINWCRVAISAWLGLRLGTSLTWDQPPLYYQPSYPLIIFQTVSFTWIHSILYNTSCVTKCFPTFFVFLLHQQRNSPAILLCVHVGCECAMFHSCCSTQGRISFFTSNFMRPWVSTSLQFCPAVLNIIAFFTRLLLLRIENFSKSQ